MGKRPILIADHDTRVASLAAHGLRKEGFQVVTAHRGEDALAMMPSQPLLIFCEVDLPGLDGMAICQSVKKGPSGEIPFFLWSRRPERMVREHALAAGADDFLVKPVYVRDVCTLAHLYGEHRGSDRVIRGNFDQLPLFYVLRALTSGVKSGRVEAPSECGVLHFREGKIVEASAGNLTGEAAIARLLVLSTGPFVVELGPVLERGSLGYSLHDLVTIDEPRRRRFEKAVTLMGGPDITLVVDFNAFSRELPQLPASTEKIVRLFDGTRTLREILRVSDLDEVSAAEAILQLCLKGVLTVPEKASGTTSLFKQRSDVVLSMNTLFPESTKPAAPGRPRPVAHTVQEGVGDFKYSDLQNLLSVTNGGWFEQPVGMAGKHLRQVVGDLAAQDVERYLNDLDELARTEVTRPEETADTHASAPVQTGDVEPTGKKLEVDVLPVDVLPMEAMRPPMGRHTAVMLAIIGMLLAIIGLLLTRMS